MSREPPGYYFGERVLLPECSSRWPWSNVFSTWTLLPGAASTKGCWTFFLRIRLCAVRNYYWSERLIARNETEKSSDEPATDQEHRPGDRADQAHRFQLIARSIIISFGCLSLVKSVLVFVYCFFQIAPRWSSSVFLRQRSALCRKYYLLKRRLFVSAQV